MISRSSLNAASRLSIFNVVLHKGSKEKHGQASRNH
jgi:hypothetical protein